MKPTAAALEIEQLRVLFGRNPGLEPISLDVARGERIAIVGTSGAGKSSLLRTIAGLQPAGGGSVRIDGADCTHAPPESRGAVYLHQTPLLFPHLDVFENVAFPLRVRRVPAAEADRRVREVGGTLGIADLFRRAPSGLSGGQRNRVALARAIAARPPVLLLDEPLSSLDPPLREEARAAIRIATAEYQPALLLVTHELAEAGALADRIGVLLDGRLAQLSSPADLFNRPASSAIAAFVGFVNRIDGSVDPDGCVHVHDLTLPLNSYLRGPVVLRFRPEAVRLDPSGPIQGIVVDRRFEPGLLRVRIDTTLGVIEAICPPHAPHPTLGQDTRLTIEPHSTVAFAPAAR